MTRDAVEPEGVWIRWCGPCQWLSPTFYRYADVLRSAGTEHNKGNGRCFSRTVGRFEYGTAAGVVGGRLPEWAQAEYWERTVDRFFANGSPLRPAKIRDANKGLWSL